MLFRPSGPEDVRGSTCIHMYVTTNVAGRLHCTYLRYLLLFKLGGIGNMLPTLSVHVVLRETLHRWFSLSSTHPSSCSSAGRPVLPPLEARFGFVRSESRPCRRSLLCTFFPAPDSSPAQKNHRAACAPSSSEKGCARELLLIKTVDRDLASLFPIFLPLLI